MSERVRTARRFGLRSFCLSLVVLTVVLSTDLSTSLVKAIAWSFVAISGYWLLLLLAISLIFDGSGRHPIFWMATFSGKFIVITAGLYTLLQFYSAHVLAIFASMVSIMTGYILWFAVDEKLRLRKRMSDF